MSFWKLFFAVVLGNIVSWILISIIGWIFWILVFSSVVHSLSDFNSRVQSSVPSQSSVIRDRRTPQQILNNVPRSLNQIQNASKAFVEKSLSHHKPPKIEQGVSSSAIKKNREMCEFWNKEFRKNPNPKYEAYRDNACLRYRNSLKQ
jgi:hypothetical protein